MHAQLVLCGGEESGKLGRKISKGGKENIEYRTIEFRMSKGGGRALAFAEASARQVGVGSM